MSDKVRVLRASVSGDEELDSQAAQIGRVYSVFSHARPEDSDNDDPNKREYLLLDDEYSIGGSHWAYPGDVEGFAATPRPSATEVAQMVASSLHNLWDEDVEVLSTHVNDDMVHVEGRLQDGDAIYIDLRVMEVSA